MTANRRLRTAKALLAGFAVTSAAHLGAIAAGAGVLQQATKPALMPLLAGYALAKEKRAPALLTGALLASTAGDVLLQLGGQAEFLAGMGAFAAAHVCYVTLFVRRGALGDRQRSIVVAAAYAGAWALIISQLWPGLGELRIAVAVYSLLLTATAATSAGLGWRSGLGGALFLLSDTLIATRLAGWASLPGHELWIMATYILAQYLLAGGVLQSEREPAAVTA